MGMVRFKNGAMMYVEASWLLNVTDGGHPTFCGTLGGIEMMRGGVAINGERPDETGAMKLFDEVYKPTPADRTYFRDEALSSTEYEARQWIQAVVEDLDPIVLPEQAAVVTEIIEAIYKSGRTGRTVIFD